MSNPSHYLYWLGKFEIIRTKGKLMTKRELIRLMAKDAGIPIAKAERALNSILMNIGST